MEHIVMFEKQNVSFPVSFKRVTITTAMLSALAGCGGAADFDINPPEGTYSSAQSVKVTIPTGATNVYLTTDAQPITNPTNNCKLSGNTTLNIDKPTMVNLRFDEEGVTTTMSFVYNITDNPIDSGLTNNEVLDAWEFLNQNVIQNLPQSSFTQSDAFGIGTISSNYSEHCCFYAEQSFTFNDYTYDYNGQNLSIDSGTVAGRSPSSGSGSYGTFQANGKTLSFSGDYNGTADGEFKTNRSDGVISTLSGYYRIHCTDGGCSAGDVVYEFVSDGEFAELASMESPGVISCD